MANYSYFLLAYPPGDRSIRSQAQTNIQKRINELGTQHISPNSPPGDRSIRSQAQTNIQKSINESENILDTQRNSPCTEGRSESSSSLPSFKLPFSAYFRSSKPKSVDTKHNYPPIGVDLKGLIQSGNLTLKVTGLRKYFYHSPSSTLDLRLRGDATLDEIKVAIKDAGASLTILPHVFSSRLRR